MSFYIRSGSDIWFKSGLGKSAFSSKIYNNLPLDYYIPGIQSTFELYHVRTRRRYKAVKPKFYMVHDSFLMFYQDSETVYSAIKKKPKKQTVWWRIVGDFTKTDEYAKLNKITKGSQELSALAGAVFLAKVLSFYEENRELEEDATKSQKVLKGINIIGQEMLAEVTEFKEAKEASEEAIKMLAGSSGHGYTHESLSVLTFLKNPDEFRRRVKLLRLTAVFMKKFMTETPTSLSHQQTVSQFGGVSGITRMLRESQLKDVLPQELAILKAKNVPESLAKTLFVLKLLQKQVMVLERSATVKPTIFVDKSGSMAEVFEGNVPKISVAAGLALALYRKFDADVYLFDTEVEKVKPSDVVKTLLTISADGGTRIEEVLEEILRIGKKDRIYIVISDGIDEVYEDTIRRVRVAGLADRIRFILVPPAWERSWLRNFRYLYARDIAIFTTAVRKILR